MITLEEVHKVVEDTLNEIRPLFADDAELTFIMRVPSHEGSHMFISNDDPKELAKILEKIEV